MCRVCRNQQETSSANCHQNMNTTKFFFFRLVIIYLSTINYLITLLSTISWLLTTNSMSPLGFRNDKEHEEQTEVQTVQVHVLLSRYTLLQSIVHQNKRPPKEKTRSFTNRQAIQVKRKKASRVEVGEKKKKRCYILYRMHSNSQAGHVHVTSRRRNFDATRARK